MPSITLQNLGVVLSGTIAASPNPNSISCTSVTASTTDVIPGCIFVAVRGYSQDGHAFVDQAFERGAVAAVVEDVGALRGRPGIVVPSGRLALSALAAEFAEHPSKVMSIIGITGTNGKTTTHWIIYHVLNALGVGTLRIGTLGTECMGRQTQSGSLTSPDPVSLHRFLADARAQGAHACVMEVSSHALDQARVEHIEFDVGIFTNLTRDHLDYHKTFEMYFAAKRRLFEMMKRDRDSGCVKPGGSAVINIDDPYGAQLQKSLGVLGLSDWSFGRGESAQIRMVDVTETSTAMVIEVFVRPLNRTVTLRVPFIGQHNAENVVGAFAACLALNCNVEQLLAAFTSIPQVPGRLERVGEKGPRVFVDYAHTPDALERAIKAVRPSTTGRLWVVFGCGGDRDKGKRPEMATVAEKNSDVVVVTSDNPRTEDPSAIISDVLSTGVVPHLVEVDRRQAIIRAVQDADELDTILIAGKGHEDYQIIGKVKFPFSDQMVASEAIGLRLREDV